MSFPYEKATFWMLLLLFLSAAYATYTGMSKVKALAAATQTPDWSNVGY